MNCVNSALDDSELTRSRRPRLELAFTREPGGPTTTPADAVEVALPSVSRWTAKAATEPELELAVIAAAIRHDLEHLGYTSANFDRVLATNLLDIMRDPLTWRTALENVGPRPNVSVRLLLPAGTAL